jgi:hypothetical protein
MPDATFRILLDVPSKNPELGFAETANALARIIEDSEPQFAIGIFGGWGSGKTTLMRAIEERLSDRRRDASRRIVPVQFSAWRYEKEQHLIVPLLDTVRERLISWSEERETEAGKKVASRTASTIGKAMNAIVAGFSMNIGVPGALQVSYDANKSLERASRLTANQRAARVSRSFYHASFRALEQSFEEFVGQRGGRRIVVFVDDLDRCLPEGALEVLESMKLFFDIEGFVFVVGLDRAVVEYIVDAKYWRDDAPFHLVSTAPPNGNGDHAEETAGPLRVREQVPVSGTDYIKKIFQVPFTLAPVDVGQLDDFLRAVYRDGGLPDAQQEDIRDKVVPHLAYLVRGSGVNPREIKRYINAYTLQRMIKGSLDADVMLTLQTIDFKPDWAAVREAFYTYRELFTKALLDQVSGQPNALQDLDPELEAVPDDFIEYVSPGRPAEALLHQHSLDEYIYSGAATRSFEDSRLLDGIRNIGELHRALRDLAQSGGTDPGKEKSVKQQASMLRSSLEPSVRGPLAPLIHRDLETLSLVLETSQSAAGAPRPEELPAWYQDSEKLVRQIRRRVLEVYRAGSAGVQAS